MLFLAHFLLSISTDKLLNDHEATTHTDDKSAIEYLSKNFPCSKHVETVSKTLNRYWTPSLVNVAPQKLIEHITLFSCKELCWLLVLSLLDNSFLQELYLLAADLQLGLNLGQVSFSRLHQLI